MARFKRVTTKTETSWSDWVKPKMRGYRLGCCDCGLAHDMDFSVVYVTRQHKNGIVEFVELDSKDFAIIFRARRNNRSTAQLRRHDKKQERKS